MKKYKIFLSENFHFLVVKFSVYLSRRVFVMGHRNYFMINLHESDFAELRFNS